MPNIYIYSLKNCPNCDTLKRLLIQDNIPHRVIDMFTPEAMTELFINGVTTRSAPVLQIDNRFYTTRELCPNAVDIDINIVRNILYNILGPQGYNKR